MKIQNKFRFFEYTYTLLRSQTKPLNSQPFSSRTQKITTSPNMMDISCFLSIFGNPYSKVNRTTTKKKDLQSSIRKPKAVESPQNKTSSWTVKGKGCNCFSEAVFLSSIYGRTGCRSDSRQHQPPSGAYVPIHVDLSAHQVLRRQSRHRTTPLSLRHHHVPFGFPLAFVFVYTVTQDPQQGLCWRTDIYRWTYGKPGTTWLVCSRF